MGKLLPVIPSWVYDLRGLVGYVDELTDFASDPGGYIRKFVVGWLLAGVAWLVRPFFDAIQLVFLGSQPGTFAGPNETLGLADLPVALAGLFGETAGSVVRSLFDTVTMVIWSLVPESSGPFGGLILTAVIVAIAVIVVRVGLPALEVGLEAVPVVGGPLSTLLSKL